MTQPIWYDSTEAGAPTLNNVAGSLLEVLRACLVNGFGAKTVTSISVSAGVATATCAAHGFTDTYGKLVLIAGATDPLLNGRKQPSNVTTNSFDFPAPGVADGTYTGSMSARRAPLGWAEEFNSGNVSIFKRTAPEASSMLLRVNDSHVAPSNATQSDVRMLEAATSVDVFTGAAPTTLGTLNPWDKGTNSATAKQWTLIGNDRAFYVVLNGYGTQPQANFFGDLVSYHGPDAYRCMLASTGRAAQMSQFAGATASGAQHLVAGNVSGLTRPVAATTCGAGSGTTIGGSSMGSPSVLAVSRPLYVVSANESISPFVRGHWPGLASPLGSQPLPHLSVSTIQGVRFLAVNAWYSSQDGQILLDLDGPWYE